MVRGQIKPRFYLCFTALVKWRFIQKLGRLNVLPPSELPLLQQDYGVKKKKISVKINIPVRFFFFFTRRHICQIQTTDGAIIKHLLNKYLDRSLNILKWCEAIIGTSCEVFCNMASPYIKLSYFTYQWIWALRINLQHYSISVKWR